MRKIKTISIMLGLLAFAGNTCFAEGDTWSESMAKGREQISKSQWKEAEGHFSKAAAIAKSLGELDPRREQSLYELARCHQKLGQAERAAQELRQVLRIRTQRAAIQTPSEEELLLLYRQSLKEKQDAIAAQRVGQRLEKVRAGQGRPFDQQLFQKEATRARSRFGNDMLHRQLLVDRWLDKGGIKPTVSKKPSKLLSPFLVSVLTALETGNVDARSLAVLILTRLGPRAAPTYLFLVDWKRREKSYLVQRHIDRALRAIPNPSDEIQNGELIAASLESDNPRVRRYAAYLIGEIANPSVRVTPELIMSLYDSDSDVVEVAIRSLSQVSLKNTKNWRIVGPEFRKILNGENIELATEVALNWSSQAKRGPLGRDALGDKILKLSKHPKQSRPVAMLRAYKEAGLWTKGCQEYLISLLQSADPELREVAVDTLVSAPLQAPQKAKLLSKLKVTPALEATLQKELMQLGNNSLPSMFQILQSEDPQLRRRARSILKTITVSKTSILKRLNHQHPEVRLWAAEKIGAMREMPSFPDGTRILEASLKDASPVVRAHAAYGLGRLRGPILKSTRRGLMKALEDKSGLVRRRSAESLGLVGGKDPAVLEALKAHKNDSSRVVRIEVKRALKRLQSSK